MFSAFLIIISKDPSVVNTDLSEEYGSNMPVYNRALEYVWSCKAITYVKIFTHEHCTDLDVKHH